MHLPRIWRNSILKNMEPIEVNSENFEEEVLKSTLPVVVDFWAPWCPPCKVIAPILEELANEYEGKIKFCKLNADRNESIILKYEIRSIPTLIVFVAGKEVDRIVGALPKDKLTRWLDKILGE